MRSAPLSAIVLAAGDGRRMRSTRPKPLHVLCGKTMLHYVLDSLSECKLERVVVVVGSTGDQVEKKLRDQSAVHYIEYVEQARALGTGDAAATALSAFAGDDDLDDPDVLVLPGDTPLLQAATVAALAEEHDRLGAAVKLTVSLGCAASKIASRVLSTTKRRATMSERSPKCPPVCTASGAACSRRLCDASLLDHARVSITCPMSWQCWPRPGTWSPPSKPTTRPRSWVSTTGCSWPAPNASSAGAPTCGGCAAASP
ncbi:MAG: hypothetical protein E6G39_00970 [Actinobacteria bacterium]|nr:MAG: hypothetical protein E6G39_00970 [Actinomycetota bacterium]